MGGAGKSMHSCKFSCTAAGFSELILRNLLCSRVISHSKSPVVLICFHVRKQVLVLQGPDKGKVGNELCASTLYFLI